jgi:uncharacterized protein YjbI with pentapeptide repeats
MLQSWPIPTLALTPARCGTVVWWMGGVQRVTAVVKATFVLVPDGSMALAPPHEIVREDEPPGARCSLHAAGELAPYVPSAALLVFGSACAPRGQTTTGLSARVGLARDGVWIIDKIIHVYGDRTTHDMKPDPFQRIEIVYERAVGGPSSPVNPVGAGEGRALPNLFDANDPSRPAGFGPVRREWAPRSQCRSPPSAGGALHLEDGFDFRFFQVAPEDQIIPSLRGDEWIALENLHPDYPWILSGLPEVSAVARLYRFGLAGDVEEEPISLVLDRLVVHADQLACSAIFRGRAALRSGEGPGLDPPALCVAAGVQLANEKLRFPPSAEIRARMAGISGAFRDNSQSKQDDGVGCETIPIGMLERPPQHGLPFVPSSRPAERRPPSAVPFALPFAAQAVPPPPPPIHNDVNEPSDPLGTTRALAAIQLPAPPPPAAVSSSVPEPAPVAPVPEPALVAPVPEPALVAPVPEPALVAPVPEPAPRAVLPVSGAGAEEPARGIRAAVAARLRAGGTLHDLDLAGADLGGLDLSGVALDHLNLEGTSLAGCTLSDASLAGANLRGADLSDALLERARLPGADLSRATLSRARLDGAFLARADLSSVKGEGTSFRDASLEGTELRQARLLGAALDGANLRGAGLAKADLSRSSLARADLRNASLRGARLREVVLLDVRVDGADLRDADLTGAAVQAASLSTARTAGAILRDLDERPSRG